MSARIAATTALLAMVALGAAGCTKDPVVVGRMGITANAKGQPVLVLATCSGSIDDVTLSQLPYGQQTANGEVGEWTTESKIHGTSRLDIGAPAPPWSGAGVSVRSALHYIASAGSSENETDALNDVTFQGRQVAALDPAKVYTNADDPDSDELVPHAAATFHDDACDR